MDLSEFLKLGLKDLHKSKISNRVVLNKQIRQTQRSDLMFSKRKIGDSPLPLSPEPKMSKVPEKPSRLEEMKKWQLERNKRRAEEKAKQKPVFKVSQTYKSKDLDTVYKEIKGKSVTTLKPSEHNFSIANSTYKFKAPANVKAIALKASKENISTKDFSTDRVTRSYKPTTIDKKPIENIRKKLNFASQSALNSTSQTLKKPEPTIVKKNVKPVVSTRNTRARVNIESSAESIPEVVNKNKQPKQAIGKPLRNNKTTKTDKATLVEPITDSAHMDNNTAEDCCDTTNLKVHKVESVQTLSPKHNISVTTPSPNSKRSPLSRQNAFDEKLTPETDRSKDSLNSSSVKDLVDKFEESISVRKTPAKTKTPAKMTPRKSRHSTLNIPTVFENDVELNRSLNVTSNSFLSPEFPIENVVITPTNDKTTPNENVYVSPFVTMSRGKKTARKEYKSRLSKGGLSVTSPEATGIKAGAVYFYKLMDDEILKIQQVCDEWQKYKEDETPPEEACDMINTAIGQSTLLITKKMQQFRGLIDSCAAQDACPLITCQDLHGFWDLLVIQIGNVNKRFENLINLRANNWEEIIPEKKKVVPVRATRKRAAKKTLTATSSIKDAIKAARKAKMQNITVVPVACEQNTFDGGFFSVKSPRKSLLKPQTPVNRASKARKSLLGSVLSSEANRHISSTSPGMAMIKATQISKAVETDGEISVYGTPGKSILKSVNAKSARKTVFFKEDNFDNKVSSPTIDLENNINANNIIKVVSEEKKESRRRSMRLSRNKLF